MKVSVASLLEDTRAAQNRVRWRGGGVGGGGGGGGGFVDGLCSNGSDGHK